MNLSGSTSSIMILVIWYYMSCCWTVFSGIGTNLGERSSKTQDEISESHKHGAKNQQEVIHWHNRYIDIAEAEGCYIMKLLNFVGQWYFSFWSPGELLLELYICQEV